MRYEFRMRRHRLGLPLLLLALAAGCASPRPAPAQTAEQEVEAFMWAYTVAWNRHDAAMIADKFYRQGPSVEEETAALKRTFDGLVAQGYDKSNIRAIKACITGPDTAWAGMRFSRLKANGEPLPPKDRASAYDLKRFEDGWRITRLTSADASTPLTCPAEGG